MKTDDRRRRSAETRAAMLENIRPKAERELNDERFDRCSDFCAGSCEAWPAPALPSAVPAITETQV